jgi:hypothetical protein
MSVLKAHTIKYPARASSETGGFQNLRAFDRGLGSKHNAETCNAASLKLAQVSVINHAPWTDPRCAGRPGACRLSSCLSWPCGFVHVIQPQTGLRSA